MQMDHKCPPRRNGKPWIPELYEWPKRTEAPKRCPRCGGWLKVAEE